MVARPHVGGGESTALLRDRRRNLRVFTKLGFHAVGIGRQDIAARRVSILELAKWYWIVQGDCLCRVYNSVSIIKRSKPCTPPRVALHCHPCPFLQLKEPLYRNAYVQYVTLPQAYMTDMFQIYTEDCVTVGWGRHIPDTEVSKVFYSTTAMRIMHSWKRSIFAFLFCIKLCQNKWNMQIFFLMTSKGV